MERRITNQHYLNCVLTSANDTGCSKLTITDYLDTFGSPHVNLTGDCLTFHKILPSLVEKCDFVKPICQSWKGRSRKCRAESSGCIIYYLKIDPFGASKIFKPPSIFELEDQIKKVIFLRHPPYLRYILTYPRSILIQFFCRSQYVNQFSFRFLIMKKTYIS